MADLLQRIAEFGDRDAFKELFQQFAPRVKSYMMRQGADAATAEELAQETLLAVWKKARLYSGDKGNATTWIFTIARNLRIDRLRREVAWQQLPDSYAETASSEAPADEALSDRERDARIGVALDELPPEQRQIIQLAYVDGLSQSEIAERLSVPIGTVKSRMRLAYIKMRGVLKDLEP